MPQDSPQGAARGRPRRQETDRQILGAALDLLREHGPGEVNVASVSARSGVARTTIYRRYRDRRELLLATLRPVAGAGAPPESLSLPDRLTWVLDRVREILADTIGMGGVAAVLLDRDPEFSDALRSTLTEALAPVRDQVCDDVEAGRLGRHVDPDLLLEMILGAYLAQRLRYPTPPEDQVGRLVRMLTAAVVGPGEPDGSAAG